MRRTVLIAAGLAGLVVVGSATSVLRSAGDAACGACHLHGRLLEEKGAAVTMGGRHGAGRVRCFQCHQGDGTVDLALTEWVAVRDTVRWAAGGAGEPERLMVPRLAEAACRRCHGPGTEHGGFHGMTAHRLDMPLACRSCHRAHGAGAERGAMGWKSGCTVCHGAAARIADRYSERLRSGR
jgi:hypothetical protein